MSRPEYSTATRVVATTPIEKNYFRKNLKNDEVSIAIGQTYNIDVLASEGKRIKYLAMQFLSAQVSSGTPAPTSGTVTVGVMDSAIIDSIIYSVGVCECRFAYNGEITFQNNGFLSTQAITTSPVNEEVLAGNLKNLQASNNGFIRIFVRNDTNQVINFASLAYASFSILTEEEEIA